MPLVSGLVVAVVITVVVVVVEPPPLISPTASSKAVPSRCPIVVSVAKAACLAMVSFVSTAVLSLGLLTVVMGAIICPLGYCMSKIRKHKHFRHTYAFFLELLLSPSQVPEVAYTSK